ncbi:hypothetical protein [Sphingobacterium paucimobilis]|uniref:ABC transporter ATPase n=1 Tax=Sphingobacterium paucimobilis HER1398 TaxID=1346330 RepID=U2J7I9_9SPHI|nr:hypothetical protein [Sphingobacterium paucimobilis]ERJ58603.1 hypothetical protein M472_07475 [Sphingobacterium paucimobilis HER1398]
MNRVWVYQADRFLTDNEVEEINSALVSFVSSWTAHGSALAGRGQVRDKLFLILEVDEKQAGVTGCSIDKSVHFLKGLGQQFGVDFFDRMKVSFRNDAGEISLVSRGKFEELVKSEQIMADTIVFNNLVQNSEQLEKEWEIPFRESWHSKVF